MGTKPTKFQRGKTTTFKSAPYGLFRDETGCLGMKTEYGEPDYPEAFVCESGEFYWGGGDTRAERAQTVVTPLDVDLLPKTVENDPDAFEALVENLEEEGRGMRGYYEGYFFNVFQEVDGRWYIIVGSEDGTLYDGVWKDSKDKTFRSALRQALRGSCLID